MTTFTIGQTVTRKGTERHGLVTKTWEHQGRSKVAVQMDYRNPAITFDAHELAAYIIASPDTVIVRSPLDGSLWAFEVLDVEADYSGVYIKDNGALIICPMSYIVRVIPAVIAWQRGA